MKTKQYIASKLGEPPESCQDDIAVNLSRKRFAVADGATREFFSEIIAKDLVNRFCNDEDDINRNIFTNKQYEKWLEPIQKSWLEYVDSVVNDKNKEVHWLVSNRFELQESGASTFVGLELKDELFSAMIIGDSCLFHIRNNQIIESYLIKDPNKFNNSPEFFFSRPSGDMIPVSTFIEPKILQKKYIKGDYFLLATDAIAKFLLVQKRDGQWKEIWNKLLINDRDWYDSFIEEKRAHKLLDDDDVSILIISTDDTDSLILFDADNSIKKELASKNQMKQVFLVSYENLEIESKLKLAIENEINTLFFRVDSMNDVTTDRGYIIEVIKESNDYHFYLYEFSRIEQPREYQYSADKGIYMKMIQEIKYNYSTKNGIINEKINFFQNIIYFIKSL